MVGRSGIMVERRALVTASAAQLAAATLPWVAGMLVNDIWMWPPSRSVERGPVPL